MKSLKKQVVFVLLVVVVFILGFMHGCNFVNGCGKAIAGLGKDVQWISEPYIHDANNQ